MKERDTSSMVLAALVSGMVGAGLAMLFAPQSGKETRAKIKVATHNASDKARQKAQEKMDYMKSKAQKKMGEVNERIAEKANEANMASSTTASGSRA
jgi:gas vesicle protein